jgi:hypothetical protein
VTDAETPAPDGVPDETPPRTARAARPEPLALTAIVLAVVDAVLLLGGVLFAFASADANGADASDRFRLLSQAANPFIAFLALVTAVVIVRQRQGADDLGRPQVASGAALGIVTAVSLAVALLALNGIITDLTGDTTALFKLSAVVSRLAAVALSAFALWLSVTAAPPRRPPSR